MKTRLARTVAGPVLALVVSAFSHTALAQCVGPDNLDPTGACCLQVNAALPPFPSVSNTGLGMCWNNCAPPAQNPLTVAWSAPTASICGEFQTALIVVPTGGSIMSGPMKLDYTRTWFEVGTTGTLVQVWRFAAKVDLSVPTSSTSTVCPIPACLPPTGGMTTAFFYGYLDYVMDCGTLTFENSLVLFHAGDFFIHKPGFSSRPGVFHPTTTYAIVAPHNSAQQFVPANLPHPAGSLVAEAVRSTGTALGSVSCIEEDALAGGVLSFLTQGCASPFGPSPTQYTLSYLTGNGNCVSPLGTPNAFTGMIFSFPTIPWPFMVSASIGSWSSSAIYPGNECAWVDEGLFRYSDACTGLDHFEVFYGGSTDNGWPVIPTTPGVSLTQKFIDLAGNWQKVLGGPNNLPLMGNIKPTNHLIYANVP